ncbi:MAG: hypothetical protein GEV03_02250 [Streptosporangiales bacterium]|nr:hypothetical protein [Streptosporangiales bacterium]
MNASMQPADRAALALGVASLVSTVFVISGGIWVFFTMSPATVPIALVLGLIACLAGWLGRPALAVSCGAVFVLAAIIVVADVALGAGLLGVNPSTAFLWVGLGSGLLAVGSAPRDD